MSDDNKAPDNQSDKAQDKAPVVEPTVKANDNAQALSNLPEKFKGKSTEDIATMYLELEKKFGEHSKEVENARQFLQEKAFLDQLLSEDEQLYKTLEQAISKKVGKQTTDDKSPKSDPVLTDLRRSEENRAIGEFQKQFGIDKLDSDKKKEMMQNISKELAEMLDPGGNKTIGQIISEISLSKLPKYLENAYWIANKEKLIDRGSISDDISSIGSISSSSVFNSNKDSLSEEEKKIAEKLGVKPEKYLERKKQINK